MAHEDDHSLLPPTTSMPGAPVGTDEERATEFTRRALLRASWTAPVILAAAFPENAYALSSGHADVHVDSHTDVVQAQFNDFNPADPDDTPEPLGNTHGDLHTDVHADQPPTPAHTDIGHQDGLVQVHVDEPMMVHEDVTHADGPPMINFNAHTDTHTDVHADGVATPAAPIHVDAHEDSHTDSHVDSHIDHSDAPAHNDRRHVDHVDLAAMTIHYDFSCGPTHQDQVHGDATGHWDHGDQFFRSNTNHYDLNANSPTRTVHCDGGSFGDHTDKPPPHFDAHTDRPPHGDSSHGDSHIDAHTDVAHRDVHVDQ